MESFFCIVLPVSTIRNTAVRSLCMSCYVDIVVLLQETKLKVSQQINVMNESIYIFCCVEIFVATVIALVRIVFSSIT